MTIPSSRHMPTSTDLVPPASRDETLDETIEDSFPASDPPSSIPDPEPSLSSMSDAYDDEGVDSSLVRQPMFWAALGAVVVSAVWLGFAWRDRRLG